MAIENVSVGNKILKSLYENGTYITLRYEQEGKMFFDIAKQYHWNIGVCHIYNARAYLYPCRVKVVMFPEQGYAIIFGGGQNSLNINSFVEKVKEYSKNPEKEQL